MYSDEEEEEEGEVVVEGGVRRAEAEEEEGEEEVEVVEGGGGVRMKRCWKDKLSLQSQFLSLTSLLIRFQTKEEILRGLPTAMAMMRKLNGGLLKQRQRAYGGTNLSLEPKKKQKLCQDHAGVPEPRRWSQRQRSEQWSHIHSR